MKNFVIPAVIGAMLTGVVSCQKNFLDLKPLDRISEAVYFTRPEQFKAASNDFYEKMISSGLGLIVGVIAYSAYHFFNMIIDSFALRVQKQVIQFVNVITTGK